MNTKAMPLLSGTWRRNSSMASRPPAEAPTPTTGNAAASRGRGSSAAGIAGSGGAGGGWRSAEEERPFPAARRVGRGALVAVLARLPAGRRLESWLPMEDLGGMGAGSRTWRRARRTSRLGPRSLA